MQISYAKMRGNSSVLELPSPMFTLGTAQTSSVRPTLAALDGGAIYSKGKLSITSWYFYYFMSSLEL